MTGNKCMVRIALMLLTITLFLNLTAGVALAKEAQFSLSIDSLSLQMGVSTNLVVFMENGQSAKVLSIEGLEHFDVLSTSQSTSTSIVNGSMSNAKNVYYIIMPKETGQFTLQAKLEYDGKTYTTNMLTVNVSEASSDVQGDAGNLFLKTLLSNEMIYFGQKAVLSYELFSRLNIENYGFLDSITMDGFIAEDLPEDQLKAGYVYINDNKYVKYDARQMLLSPIKTGTYTIPSYNFQVNVSTGDFFSSSKPVYLQTNPVTLTVNPLPTENQPADFSGVVGTLHVDSSYSKQELNYGDSLTLHVTASGNCNLDSLDKIFNHTIPGFSVYETQKNVEEGIENNQYHASRDFEIILIPEGNGELTIDPVSISYFDPATGTYEKAEIPGTTVMVYGEIPETSTHTPIHNQNDSVETIKIEQVSDNTQGGEYLTIQLKKDTLYLAGWICIALLALGAAVLFFFKWRKKQNSALNTLFKRIMKSKEQNEIYNLFNHLIKLCFNISLKASTRDVIKSSLSPYGLDVPVLDIQDWMENGRTSNTENRRFHNTINGRSSNTNLFELKNKIKIIYKKLKRTTPTGEISRWLSVGKTYRQRDRRDF